MVVVKVNSGFMSVCGRFANSSSMLEIVGQFWRIIIIPQWPNQISYEDIWLFKSEKL